MKKLELKNLKVKKITQEEQSTINGGREAFLSIGYNCSAKNMCSRHETKTWGYCPYN